MVDGAPNNAAIFKPLQALNVLLEARRRSDAEATFLQFICASHFCPDLSHFHTNCTLTNTQNTDWCWGTDAHFSHRHFAYFASESTCLTSCVYMMINSTFNLLPFCSACSKLFNLINDRALKATKC